MRKLLSGLLFIALCLAYPLAVKQSQATVTITPNVRFDACAQANYTRIAPNFCSNDNSVASIGLISDATCRSIGAGSVPAGSTAILLGAQQFIFSANAVALREINTTFWQDSGCTVSAGRQMRLQAREWVALAAVTMLNIDHSSTMERVAVASGATQIWYKSTLTLCVNCGIGVSVLGYYDS
jgi:hypothetical protein